MWLTWALMAIGVLITTAVLTAAVRGGKPVRRLAASGAQGLCALGLVNLLGPLTGVSLGFSWLSAGVCAVMGIPGTVGLLLVNAVFSWG